MENTQGRKMKWTMSAEEIFWWIVFYGGCVGAFVWLLFHKKFVVAIPAARVAFFVSFFSAKYFELLVWHHKGCSEGAAILCADFNKWLAPGFIAYVSENVVDKIWEDARTAAFWFGIGVVPAAGLLYGSPVFAAVAHYVISRGMAGFKERVRRKRKAKLDGKILKECRVEEEGEEVD